MVQFKDLEFKPHPSALEAITAYEKNPEIFEGDSLMLSYYDDIKGAVQAVVCLEGVTISIIGGSNYYYCGSNSYEVGIYTEDDASDIEVYGYMSETEIDELLAKYQK